MSCLFLCKQLMWSELKVRLSFLLSLSNIEARTFYSFALQRLPGVVRAGKAQPIIIESHSSRTDEPWRPFNRCALQLLHRTTHSLLRFTHIFTCVWWCPQVQGVHGRPGVHPALLSACGGGCSPRHQRRGPVVSEEVHLHPGKGEVTAEHLHMEHVPI